MVATPGYQFAPTGPGGSGPFLPMIYADVSAYPYNCDPTGVFDATTEIQAAVNSGIPVYVPPGTFLINSTATITVPSGTRIFGSSSGQIFADTGPGVSILQSSATATTHALTLTPGNSTGVIEDIQINGGSNTAAVDAIHQPTASHIQAEWIISRCLIEKFTGGIGVNIGTFNGGITVRDTLIYDNKSGIQLLGTDAWIINSTIVNNVQYGIIVAGTLSTIGYNSIGGNGIDGIHISTGAAGARCIIIGNAINLCGQHGIYVGDSGAVIVGNSIHTNSQTTDNTYADIQVAAFTGVSPVISGNNFWYEGTGNKSNFNIGFSGGAVPAIGSSNTFDTNSSHQGITNVPANFGPQGGVTKFISPLVSTATGTSAITTIVIGASPIAASTGDTFTITDNAGNSQTVTLTAPLFVGVTSVTVTSFTPSVSYPIGAQLIPLSVTYTVPNGVQWLKVQATGAGGSGGGSAGSSTSVFGNPGAGGAAGEAIERLMAVVPGTACKITLGQAQPGGIAGTTNQGAAGGDGTAGGASVFNYNSSATIITANGGGPGKGGALGAPAASNGGVYAQSASSSTTLNIPGCGGATSVGGSGLNAANGFGFMSQGGGGGGSSTSASTNGSAGQPGDLGGSSTSSGLGGTINGGSPTPAASFHNNGAGGSGAGGTGTISGGTAGQPGGTPGSGQIILTPMG